MLTNKDLIILSFLVKDHICDLKQFYGLINTDVSENLIKRFEEIEDKLLKMIEC